METLDTQSKSTEELFSYQLGQFTRAFRGLASDRLAEIGLHPGQNSILHQLAKEDGLTQSELADRLDVQQPTAAKMTQRMEKAGLITRRPCPDDARVSRAYLTDKGRDLLRPIHDFWQRLDDHLTEGFSLEERILLRRFVKQLQENIE